MNIHTLTTQPCAEDLVPSAILRRVTDRAHFLDDMARYGAMDDDDLYRATEVCLRNLEPLDDEGAGADADLRLVLVPELWDRLRPGSRDPLRRITSRLAEYRGDRPSFFDRLLSAAARTRLSTSAEDLRARLADAAKLDARSLVEQARFAIAGSRSTDKWPPDYCVYEPGFTYRLVPVVAWRVLLQDRRGLTARTAR